MTNHFALGMTKAAELTKAGKLTEATALIQSLLSKNDQDQPTPPERDVIEGMFTRLDGSPADSARRSKPPRTHDDPPRVRTTLRETLRKIAAGRMADHAPLARGHVDLPAGAQFITLTHASGRDQRDYKLYIPAKRPAAPMPLIVMLHGCTQTPDDFAAGTDMNALAEQHGLLVAYPAQPAGANANKCWNWFKPDDQGRDRGEPALIAGLTRDILRAHPVDPSRVYIAGLSAGGAAAAIVATAYPDLFCAAAVHSGLPVGAAGDIPSALSAMRTGAAGRPQTSAVPTIVIHGTADSTVHPRNGTAVVTQALCAFPGLQSKVARSASEGGRSIRQTRYIRSDGRSMCEHWEIEGAGHAWAGGRAAGSFTDPRGPAASQEILRFFRQHRLA